VSAAPVPPPHRLRRIDGTLRLTTAALIPADGNPAHLPAADRLEEGFDEAAVAVRRGQAGTPPRAAETPVRLRLDGAAVEAPGAAGHEAYRLEVTPSGVEIVAGAAAGLYYGAETLLGWLAAHAPPEPDAPAEMPAVRIRDYPGFRHRGLLLDISRNRVPTFESLRRLVDGMAALKLNQLQLYTEHTFAYRGHEIVWREASPLTADEVRRLDAHCRQRFVELVPNQNSFGHLHRWLKHEPYRRLAEVPEGMPHPFADEPEPFSLCPVDPGAIDLLRDLYDQLLPLFTSRQFNVGCDETFDLGKGRSAEACRQRGTGRVYVEFLRRLHALAAGHGRRLQFWGDILAGRPELLPQVPGDAVVLEWGYEAGHPFAERAAALAGAGLEFYLCPGTSSWNSFAGRLDNALANLAEAARAGVEHGASGYLITDWGDFGHLQPPPVSWPALLAGAVFAWRPATAADPSRLPLAALVDRHARRDLAVGTGEILTALGNVYRETGVTPSNASALFKLVIFAHRTLAGAGLDGLTAAALERSQASVDRAGERLASLAAGGPAEQLVRAELDWVAGMLRFACRLGRARLEAGRGQPTSAIPANRRRTLARRLDRRIDELSPLWLARSRPGGLENSRRRRERVRALLQP
jgi:hexosaminidase